MAPSEDVEWWYYAVYTTVQSVPYGKCTTYGHIAHLVGHPQRARQVGVCLRRLPSGAAYNSAADAIFNSQTVPWQRVINSKGGISSRRDGGQGEQRQADKLRQEGAAL